MFGIGVVGGGYMGKAHAVAMAAVWRVRLSHGRDLTGNCLYDDRKGCS